MRGLLGSLGEMGPEKFAYHLRPGLWERHMKTWHPADCGQAPMSLFTSPISWQSNMMRIGANASINTPSPLSLLATLSSVFQAESNWLAYAASNRTSLFSIGVTGSRPSQRKIPEK